jgi:polysaccharide deacetylase 2 family uncharacterized protein YibQ
MGNLTKNQQRREITKAQVKQAKQKTIDDIVYQFNIQKTKGDKPKKTIIINDITTTTKEDEIALKLVSCCSLQFLPFLR